MSICPFQNCILTDKIDKLGPCFVLVLVLFTTRVGLSRNPSGFRLPIFTVTLVFLIFRHIKGPYRPAQECRNRTRAGEYGIDYSV